jgi:hypothetical protein
LHHQERGAVMTKKSGTRLLSSWPVLTFAILTGLFILAAATDNGLLAGMLIGRAAGSLVDPVFLVLVAIVTAAGRRWWVFFSAALALSLGYSYYAWVTRTELLPEAPFSWDAVAGRLLATVFAGAVFWLMRFAVLMRSAAEESDRPDQP